MPIPKTIHYCWFGGNPLGPDELKCIDSWRHYFPDYKIKQWDESNFNVRCCSYVSEAYDAKQWAFVSDYARFAILHEHGGVYFDTDVEIIRSMDDIVARGPFMGFEIDANGYGNNCVSDSGFGLLVNPGLGLAANSGFSLLELILASYEADSFVRMDGTLNQKTVVARVTDILKTCGLADVGGIQTVAGVTIYPSDYFNPKDFQTGVINVTSNTRSIHHFKMSWLTPTQQREHRYKAAMLRRGMNAKHADLIAKVAAIARGGDYLKVLNKLSRMIHGGHNR